jgi:hypothetical protein
VTHLNCCALLAWMSRGEGGRRKEERGRSGAILSGLYGIAETKERVFPWFLCFTYVPPIPWLPPGTMYLFIPVNTFHRFHRRLIQVLIPPFPPRVATKHTSRGRVSSVKKLPSTNSPCPRTGGHGRITAKPQCEWQLTFQAPMESPGQSSEPWVRKNART